MFQNKPEKIYIDNFNQLFLCSDLHFFHSRICEFTERKKYTNTEQHTQWLIQQLNKHITPNCDTYKSTVLHLGDDFFSCSLDECVNVIKQLNGDANEYAKAIKFKISFHSSPKLWETPSCIE